MVEVVWAGHAGWFMMLASYGYQVRHVRGGDFGADSRRLGIPVGRDTEVSISRGARGGTICQDRYSGAPVLRAVRRSGGNRLWNNGHRRVAYAVGDDSVSD